MLQPKFKKTVEVDQLDVNGTIAGFATRLPREAAGRNKQANFPIAPNDASKGCDIFARSCLVSMLHLNRICGVFAPSGSI